VRERSGDSRTDAINRAVQVYDYLDEVWHGGGLVQVQRTEDGPFETVRVF
jgi:hypothetical protein